MGVFDNLYDLRLVAEKDNKACSICYKPCTSVMLSSNKADFFYVCRFHLKDSEFAVPIIPPEYKEIETSRDNKQQTIRKLKIDLESSSKYSWSALTRFAGFGAKDGTPETGDAKAAKDAETEERPSEENKTTPTPKSTDQIRREIKNETMELKKLEDELANFNFKKYVLNKDIYNSRVKNYIQSRTKAEKRKQIHEPGFFPSVPTSNPNTANKPAD